MGRRKKLLKAVEHLRVQIALHQRKVAGERMHPAPQEGLLRYWENEISSQRQQLAADEVKLLPARERRRLSRFKPKG